MTKNSYSEGFKQLALDDRKRSQTARLRDHFAEIEATLALGITRASIIEMLAENGFEVPLGSFNSALHRLRKEAKEGSAPKPVNQAKATIPKTEDARQGDFAPAKAANFASKYGEAKDDSKPYIDIHNPADLDEVFRNPMNLEALAQLSKKKRT
jgi:hypothetical protein